MNTLGYILISTVAVLASPWSVEPQKGPRNIVFDDNLYIAEDMEQSSLALLHYFISDNMINAIQKITNTNFQKAFIVTNICPLKLLTDHPNLLIQISSITKNTISTQLVTADIKITDYTCVGDILQVSAIDLSPLKVKKPC